MAPTRRSGETSDCRRSINAPAIRAKLLALNSKAFTPRTVTILEPRIAELSRELLDRVIDRGEMDLAVDYAIPLPLMVIAEMLGIPPSDRPRFRHWNDVMVNMSYTIPGGKESAGALNDFIATTTD